MKFNIITLGCKVNAYESNYISESLVNNGFSFCDDFTTSDIVIINTCSVTDMADKKSLKEVKKVKRLNPNALIVVCGCSSQNNFERYQELGINILIGNKQKSKIVSLIQDYLINQENYCYITKERLLPFENMSISKFNQVRAYIKIQDGCNNFCSYCIIPYVRGDVRSRDFDNIISEAKKLVANNYKEIVLTGIHTGAYNDNGKDLCDLISVLSMIPGLSRIRLSSVEITELNDKFLNLLRNNFVLCNHLHIPLQSGCDEILKVMNRKYNTDYYRDKIKKIRAIRPDISITTDVIVGHNYETDELFAKTYSFCEEMQFAKIHVFPFSSRKGTASSRMDGVVDENTKKIRTKKLINLSNELEKKYYHKFIGQELDILIEKNENGKSVGHTSNYLNVTIDENLSVNEIYRRVIK